MIPAIDFLQSEAHETRRPVRRRLRQVTIVRRAANLARTRVCRSGGVAPAGAVRASISPLAVIDPTAVIGPTWSSPFVSVGRARVGGVLQRGDWSAPVVGDDCTITRTSGFAARDVGRAWCRTASGSDGFGSRAG